MTDELLRLAAICEQGEGASLVLDRNIALSVYPDAKALPWDDSRISTWDDNGRTQLTVKPYTASIDAALTLTKDVGVLFTLSDIKGGGRPMCVIVSTETAALFEAVADTMPLALCAAALKARASMEKTDDRQALVDKDRS